MILQVFQDIQASPINIAKNLEKLQNIPLFHWPNRHAQLMINVKLCSIIIVMGDFGLAPIQICSILVVDRVLGLKVSAFCIFLFSNFPISII